MDGWTMREPPGDPFAINLAIKDDGTVYGTLDGAVTTEESGIGPISVFNDATCAQLGAQLMALAGVIYKRAEYFGPVDLMFEASGHEGALGDGWFRDTGIPPSMGPPFLTGEMRGELRVAALALLPPAWAQTARDLLGRMIEVSGPPKRPDLFGS
jgi:hypothetical protein